MTADLEASPISRRKTCRTIHPAVGIGARELTIGPGDAFSPEGLASEVVSVVVDVRRGRIGKHAAANQKVARHVIASAVEAQH